jgi:hypothetical protein
MQQAYLSDSGFSYGECQRQSIGYTGGLYQDVPNKTSLNCANRELPALVPAGPLAAILGIYC